MPIEDVRALVALWHDAFDAVELGDADEIRKLIPELSGKTGRTRPEVYGMLGWVSEAYCLEAFELMGPILEWEFAEFRKELTEL